MRQADWNIRRLPWRIGDSYKKQTLCWRGWVKGRAGSLTTLPVLWTMALSEYHAHSTYSPNLWFFYPISLQKLILFSAMGVDSKYIVFTGSRLDACVRHSHVAIQRQSSRGSHDTGPRPCHPRMQTWLHLQKHSLGVCFRARRIHTSKSSQVAMCLVPAQNRSWALFWSWEGHLRCAIPWSRTSFRGQ